MVSGDKHAGFEVVEAAVSRLRPNPRNPRTIRPARLEQLCRTMAAEPDLLRARPVVALLDGTVIAGNQRLAAARRLGWASISTVFVDLDGDRAGLWAFLDNRGFGEDDEDLAGELLAELKARGTDLDLTGFERSETDRLLRRLAHRDRDADTVPVLAETVEPNSELGKVYELGPHRLMCGDATNPEHVAVLLGGLEATLVVTDPPYGVGLDHGWRDRAGLGTGGARTDAHATTSLLADERVDWADAYQLAPSAEVVYAWHASRHAAEVQVGLERVGFEVRQQIIWDKGAFVLSRQHYHWRHEPCLYAVRAGSVPAWYGGRTQSTIWQAESPKMQAAPSRAASDKPVDHPTQKPVALFTRPIENHLQPGEAVYDPFAGSGTCLIAAELTGRVCLAMELDPRCVDLIRARWEAFTSEQ